MLLVSLYYLLLACLSIYGLHRGVLLYLYATGSNKSYCEVAGTPSHKRGFGRRVTIQLPIFNERFGVESAIVALSSLRYPRELF